MSLIWLEIVLGFGVPVAWGLRELHLLRRDKRAAEARAARQAEQAALHPDATPATRAPAPPEA